MGLQRVGHDWVTFTHSLNLKCQLHEAIKTVWVLVGQKLLKTAVLHALLSKLNISWTPYEKVTGRKARDPQGEEISCKWQMFFICFVCSFSTKNSKKVCFKFCVVRKTLLSILVHAESHRAGVQVHSSFAVTESLRASSHPGFSQSWGAE